MAVNREQVEKYMGYGSNVREAFLNSFDVDREYFVNGNPVDPQEIPEYGEPDQEIYRGISREEYDKAASGTDILYSSFREPPINEDVVIDNVVSAVEGREKLEIFVPWNTGQSQSSFDINKRLTSLNSFAEVFNDLTGILIDFRIYSLDEYSELNNSSYEGMNDLLEMNVSYRENTSFLPWDEFTEEALDGDWDQLKKEAEREVAGWPDSKKQEVRKRGKNMEGDSLKYSSLRLAESKGMDGKVRLSPGQNSGQGSSDDSTDIVPRIDQQFEGEGVIYLNCFYGPWKSDYDDINLMTLPDPELEVMTE